MSPARHAAADPAGQPQRWLRTIAPVTRDERWARAAWTRVAEPGDPSAAALVCQLGPVEALITLADPSDEHHRTLRDRAIGVDFSALRDFAGVTGLQLVAPGDEGWPGGLQDLDVPPIALWIKGPGHLGELTERSVAVVGSRAATSYGVGVAQDIAAGLAASGRTVVSGAAYGIDGHAHRGALAADGDTIAVLAGGPDRYYPAGNAGLIARIGQVGALVSEVCPGGAPTRSRFLQRNRLIAAMTQGTLVVEAGLRSGSLNTARTAARMCRPVGAVPGPVVSPTSAGCHQLVREGQAVLVTDAVEMIELVGELGRDAAPRRSAPVSPEDELPEPDRLVLGALPVRAAVPAQDVARAAAVSLVQAHAALARLETLGFAVRSGQAWRKVTRTGR